MKQPSPSTTGHIEVGDPARHYLLRRLTLIQPALARSRGGLTFSGHPRFV
jgi:hypothetical protein